MAPGKKKIITKFIATDKLFVQILIILYVFLETRNVVRFIKNNLAKSVATNLETVE